MLKAQLSAASASQTSLNNIDSSDDRLKVDQLQHQIQSLMNEISHQKTKIVFYEFENSRLLQEVELAKSTAIDVGALRNENAELSSKIESMTKDQEDLLELLADQDLKMRDYRRKLRGLGQSELSDDEN